MKITSGDTLSYHRQVLIPASISHPAVLSVIGCTQLPDPPTIISPFIEGGSLQSVLEQVRHGKPPEWWTFTAQVIILFGVAAGFQELHEHRVIHRDLNPLNVLLDNNHEPKIAGFSLSRFVPPGTDLLKNTGTMGSPLFAAPEVADGKPYDFRSDVFSFGLMIYAVLTGAEPFQEANAVDINTAKIGGTRPQFPPDVPARIVSLANSCWDGDPERRPRFREIIEELNRLVDDNGGSIPTLSSWTVRDYRSRITGQRRLRDREAELDSVKRATHSLRAELDYSKRELAAKSIQCAGANEALASGERTWVAKSVESELVKRNLSVETSACERLKTELGSAREALQSQTSEFETAKRDLALKRSECVGLQEDLDDARDELASKSGEFATALADLRAKAGNCERSLRAELEAAKRDLGSLPGELDRTKYELALKSKECEQLTAQLRSANQELASRPTELDKVQRDLTVKTRECHELRADLDEAARELREQIAECDLIREGSNATIRACKRLKAELETANRKIASKTTKFKIARRDLAAKSTGYDRLKADLNAANQECATLIAKFEAAKRDLGAKSSECDHLRAELGAANPVV
jgi:serine/threonine protein kinase